MLGDLSGAPDSTEHSNIIANCENGITSTSSLLNQEHINTVLRSWHWKPTTIENEQKLDCCNRCRLSLVSTHACACFLKQGDTSQKYRYDCVYPSACDRKFSTASCYAIYLFLPPCLHFFSAYLRRGPLSLARVVRDA